MYIAVSQTRSVVIQLLDKSFVISSCQSHNALQSVSLNPDMHCVMVGLIVRCVTLQNTLKQIYV